MIPPLHMAGHMPRRTHLVAPRPGGLAAPRCMHAPTHPHRASDSEAETYPGSARRGVCCASRPRAPGGSGQAAAAGGSHASERPARGDEAQPHAPPGPRRAPTRMRHAWAAGAHLTSPILFNSATSTSATKAMLPIVCSISVRYEYVTSLQKLRAQRRIGVSDIAR